MRVFVTRPENEAQHWVQALRRRGLDAFSLPLIVIGPAPRPQELLEAWEGLDRFRAVMFVSGNAVRNFFAYRPPKVPWPDAARAWATGPGTRQALLRAGVPISAVDAPPLQAPQFDSESLWQQVSGQVSAGDRVLMVRGGDAATAAANGRDWLAEQLGSVGAQVEAVVAYLRGLPAWNCAERAQAVAGAADAAWLFSSSQAISNLQALMPQQDWRQASAVATHPRIGEAARLAGFGVVCESRPSLDAVAAALESFR